MPKSRIILEPKWMYKIYNIMSNQTDLHDNQDIQRVTIFTESSRDEAIVMRVHNWWVEYTVNLHMEWPLSKTWFIYQSNQEIILAHLVTFISPDFLSSSYFTLVPLGISTTCTNQSYFVLILSCKIKKWAIKWVTML